MATQSPPPSPVLQWVRGIVRLQDLQFLRDAARASRKPLTADQELELQELDLMIQDQALRLRLLLPRIGRSSLPEPPGPGA